MKQISMKQTIKQSLWLVLLLLAALPARSQSLSLDSCQAWAQQNFPLVKLYDLLQQTTEYSVQNAAKGYLPRISVNGQATYQSAVTELPFTVPIPGVNIESLSKDQYKLYAEVVQPLSDLAAVKHQKDLVEVNGQAERQQLDVELYKLKDRINQLYFGILLIDSRLEQVELLKQDLKRGIATMDSAVALGVALSINSDLLKAELLKANQQTTELQASRKAYMDVLALFLDRIIDPNTQLEVPETPDLTGDIARPELSLFDTKQQVFGVQTSLLKMTVMPHVSLFFQGGYGRPALNFLSNNFDPYYVGGIRLNWNFTAFYTYGKQKKVLELQRNSVDVQRQVFLFNISTAMTQQNNEINKLQQLLQSDQELADLRGKIKTTALSQLENGVITSNDYLSYVNAEDLARQNLELRKIQLLMAQYNYQNTIGN